MPLTPKSNRKKAEDTRIVFEAIGVILLFVSAFPPLSLLVMVLRPFKGNHFGADGMAIFAMIVIIFVISLPCVVAGLALVRKFSNSRLLGVAAWGAAMPTITAVTLSLFSIGWAMRPIPTYNSGDYQHLVGKSLAEVRSNLDTRQSVSSYGKSDRTLLLRGMVIVATRKGVVTQVKPRR